MIVESILIPYVKIPQSVRLSMVVEKHAVFGKKEQFIAGDVCGCDMVSVIKANLHGVPIFGFGNRLWNVA